MCNCTCVGAPAAPAPASSTARAGGGTTPPTTPPSAPLAPARTAGNAASAQAAGSERLLLPVGNVRVTSHFGSNEALRGGHAHTGTDYSAPTGTPIHAAASGTVVFAGWAQGGGGNVVTIDHGNGWFTSYAHQSAVGVRVGDVVHQGDVVGKVGATGDATGPHLHFGLLHGGTNPDRYSVDPEAFMRAGRTV
jgi:murein DD-endopeptidase MepM/ murein hydrolase activator NlpD